MENKYVLHENETMAFKIAPVAGKHMMRFKGKEILVKAGTENMGLLNDALRNGDSITEQEYLTY